MTAAAQRPIAKGVQAERQPGIRQIVVRVEDEVFTDIQRRAHRDKTSFTEQVRILLEWGLEAAALEESAER